MTQIQHIPLAEIDEHALPRDRSVIDAAALDELTASIRASGLRQRLGVGVPLLHLGRLFGRARLRALGQLD